MSPQVSLGPHRSSQVPVRPLMSAIGHYKSAIGPISSPLVSYKTSLIP